MNEQSLKYFSKIIEERIKRIEYELEELLGEYTRVDYEYDEGESLYTRDIKKLIDYVEWELENNSYGWQERSERDKREVIKLLSEYIILTK